MSVNFKLSLAAVRYQDIRVVPNQANLEDQAKKEQNKFDHVLPDHQTVAILTNHLSDEGYYVKRVIENPPQTGKRADIVNRYWDIAGRRYNGVYPIEFHLILTGEEVHEGHLLLTGTTTTSLSVRGTYATPEMEQRVIDEWERLQLRVRDVMNGCRHTAGANGAAQFNDKSVDGLAEEIARLRNVAMSLREELEATVDSGDIPRSFVAGIINRIDEEFGLHGESEYQ